jgi:hypothetical protein
VLADEVLEVVGWLDATSFASAEGACAARALSLSTVYFALPSGSSSSDQARLSKPLDSAAFLIWL